MFPPPLSLFIVSFRSFQCWPPCGAMRLVDLDSLLALLVQTSFHERFSSTNGGPRLDRFELERRILMFKYS